MTKQCIVFGNGKSLEGYDFTKINRDKYDIVGTGMAFRHWRRIKWYPNIYVNVDVVVCQNPDVIKFIQQNKCDMYILSKSILALAPDIKSQGNVLFIEDLKNMHDSAFKLIRNWCSGSIAVISVLNTYEHIHLLGIDCDYVEYIVECEKLSDGTLSITKTPETNPNYFFNDYQRKGDRYNVPNGKRVHMQSWKELKYIIEYLNNMYPERYINITNYNDKKSISEYIPTRRIFEFNKR